MGRVVDLGGDGDVVEVGGSGGYQPRQPVDQLVEAVEGHKARRQGLAGNAQIVRQLPGGPAQEAVKDDEGHGKEDVLV